jgi:hypothetical protein
MKSPSKNVSRSLRGQRAPGRKQTGVSVSKLTTGGSMIVPGEGGVEDPPGARHTNSAKDHADALGRLVGGR